MKDAKGHGSDAKGGGVFNRDAAREFANRIGTGSHQAGVEAVGKPFRMNSYTHEIVHPSGEVVARMKLGKSNGFAVDQRGAGGIRRSSGTAIHDAVMMPDYYARSKGSFPAEHIGGELRYLTGNDFAGHTVRRKS